jgi:hypothetical protein
MMLYSHRVAFASFAFARKIFPQNGLYRNFTNSFINSAAGPCGRGKTSFHESGKGAGPQCARLFSRRCWSVAGYCVRANRAFRRSRSVSSSNNLIAGGNSNNASSDNSARGVRNANNALSNANTNNGVRAAILASFARLRGSLASEMPALEQLTRLGPAPSWRALPARGRTHSAGRDAIVALLPKRRPFNTLFPHSLSPTNTNQRESPCPK